MKKYVKVQFSPHSIAYTYFTDIDLEKTDYVVVDSTNGIGIARVSSVNPSRDDKKKAYSWVLCKVDVEACRARIKGKQ